MKKVIIQGVRGSFHEEAAQIFFQTEELEIVPAHSFTQLMNQFEEDHSINAAVMAIENSIGGSILHNYKLLQESNCQILGEIYLKIEQNLLVNKGVEIGDIKEVHSHPMAIKQCAGFFRQFPHIRLIESEDTALSAANVSKSGSRVQGAIAGRRAAYIYGLEMINRGIETQKQNYTRFFIIKRVGELTKTKSPNKASIYFRVKHESGSLAKVLNIIASIGINLSKIQSFPIPKLLNEYYIHIDMEYEGYHKYTALMEMLPSLCLKVGELGTYKKAVIS